MSSDRERMTVFSAGAEHEGEPVTFSQLHLNYDDEGGVQSGRLEIVVSDVSEQGSELSFTTYEGSVLGESAKDGKDFLHQHGVEVGFDDTRIGQVVPNMEVLPHVGFREAKNVILGSKVLRAMNNEEMWTTEWAVGREESVAMVRRNLAITGLSSDMLFSATYYGLLMAPEEQPRLYDPAMGPRTATELQMMEEADMWLESQQGVNYHLQELIDEARKSELPAIAETEFVEHRRSSHDKEMMAQAAVNNTAVNLARWIRPSTGYRGYPSMDASRDDNGSFGVEQNYLRNSDRISVMNALRAEYDELRKRRSSIADVKARLNTLSRLERHA